MTVTPYHIQNVLKNFHRRLRRHRVGNSVRTWDDAVDSFLRMTQTTSREIERQVAFQIRRRLISRTSQE